MQSDSSQQAPEEIEPTELVIIPLDSQRDRSVEAGADGREQSPEQVVNLEVVSEQCMISGIARPVETDPAADGTGRGLLDASAIEEVGVVQHAAATRAADLDAETVRQRALDMLMRSEEEAHEIIETAQREAASRAARSELKAQLTLDQARERADLLISSAEARGELRIQEACSNAVAQVEEEARRTSETVVGQAKVEAKNKLQFAAVEARKIVDRARGQGNDIVAAAEGDAEERRQAAIGMFEAIESLEQKVERDAIIAAQASAEAAEAVLGQAQQDAEAIRQAATAMHADLRTQADMTVRNAHVRSEQIISGAEETATWFAERVHARDAIVRASTEAHVSDMLDRAESASLDVLLNARERCAEMIADAQQTVDRMLAEGRRVAQDLVGNARSSATSHAAVGDSFAGIWNENVADDALVAFATDPAVACASTQSGVNA